MVRRQLSSSVFIVLIYLGLINGCAVENRNQVTTVAQQSPQPTLTVFSASPALARSSSAAVDGLQTVP